MMIGQVVKRYKDMTISFRWTAKLLVFAAFLYFLSFLASEITTIRYFHIKEVKIVGALRTDHAEVEHLLMPLVNKTFFNVNVETVKERIQLLPWVGTAAVRRVWPSEILVEVKEKVPVAQWNGHSLLSDSGEVFSPPAATYPTNLPLFFGPEGEQMTILSYYTSINAVLQPLHTQITRFEVTPSRAVSVTLANGITLNVGYKDSLTRLTHFVKVYPKIVGDRASAIDYIDLRYANGLAVRWKTVS